MAVFAGLLFVNNAFCKVNVHFPVNYALLESSTITISGFSDKKIREDLTVVVEGRGAYDGKTRRERFKFNSKNVFNVEVRLYPGINKIVILDESDEGRYVYFDDKTEKAPSHFSRYYEHSEPECGNCHKMKPVFSKKIIAGVNEICSDCHDKVEGKILIHPGFKENNCVDCHDPHFSKYKGHLVKEIQELCYDCHDNVTKIEGAEFTVVHPPLIQEGCVKCHEPHAGNNAHLLHLPKYDLCTSCHPEPGEFGHADIYDDCSMCHEHHSAERFLLLKEEYWESCLDCHDEVADQKFKHHPDGRGCGDCHDPHSDTDLDSVKRGCRYCHKNNDPELSRFHGGLELSVEKCLKCHTPHDAYNKRLLKSKLHFPLTQAGNCITCHMMEKKRRRKLGWNIEKSEVCFKCHGNKRPLADYDKSIHQPVFSGDCTQCHSPHLKLANAQLLLKREELCYKCHESFIEKSKDFENGSMHPPVGENDCLVCHNPHKSENDNLLKSRLNILCFECHYEKVSDTSDQTLLYYHEPPTKDLCTSCHDPHMSKKKKLLK
jgi:predicted CXXCH cytochrome family protein